MSSRGIVYPWLVTILVAGCGASPGGPVANTKGTRGSVRAVSAASSVPALDDALRSVVSLIDGRVAVAVVDVEDDRQTTVRGDEPMPQHSTFKLWLAVAAADLVERGEARWDDKVRVRPSDLVFSYQPIAEKVGPNGRAFMLAELVRWMLVLSDNPSADAVIRHLGGTDAVESALHRLAVHGVRIRSTEAVHQEQASRLRERFQGLAPADAQARVRRAVARDPNPATALGVAEGLARLARGELLGEDATRRILTLLKECKTGLDRLRAGLPSSWALAHKTGTGSEIAGVSLGTNDIGILTSPSGQRFAVAVFVAGTTASAEDRARVIANTARAVVEHAEK